MLWARSIAGKFEAIIQCIYASYPDIAGSASSVNSKKGYALHEYKLPDGTFGDWIRSLSTMQATKVTWETQSAVLAIVSC